MAQGLRTVKRRHTMPFGAQLRSDGRASFRLWAPDAQRVDLVDGAGVGIWPMQALPQGCFELVLQPSEAPARYAFRIDGGDVVPDPASRCNPDGVHGASAWTDPLAFDWPDPPWRGRPWHEAVIYELHVGAFTAAGSFVAAIERLDALVALGITAVELMPVAAFAGRRSWGYDGVLPFAPDASYGTPDELKRLVATAQGRGLMVLLDVVYNHFGPEGNVLYRIASPFFRNGTPGAWGAAIDFDGVCSRTVRDFFIHNALYWIEELGFDGLRIDAVHAMHDRSTPHIVDEIAMAVRAGPGRERHVHLVLENERNDAQRLRRRTEGQPALADAQWNEDLQHALHVIVTGETQGYYAGFAADPVRRFGRALAEGFAGPGEASAFVNFAQTHDQVGNRPRGERISMLAAVQQRSEALRALLACVLLAPSPPLLFMGEEYAASTPFLYFCDYTGALADAVAAGRRADLARLGFRCDDGAPDSPPDPNDPISFARSKLDWCESRREPHARWLALYTQLLRCRREWLLPWLHGARIDGWSLTAPSLLRICWALSAGRRWHLLAQLAPHGAAAAAQAALPGCSVYRSHAAATELPGWSVQVTIEGP
jgi:malto-oligosyltrehalose trehalohydrolase